ncbi:MAG: hypothetical protein EXQ58_06295 [Acidobacteria bacterium]|nr:hypothetical protein [Acidobacteriota bacterium]
MKKTAFASALWALCVVRAAPAILAQATETYTVSDGTRIQVRLETTLNSKTHRSGDRFTAKVVEAIMIGGKEVIPAGTTVEGRVSEVKTAGRVKGRSEMNLSYERLIFPNGVSETIVASLADLDETQKEEVDRKEGPIRGESSRKRDATEVAGGAAGGAKGSAIGAGVGGLIGLGDSMRREGKEIEIPAGTRQVIRLEQPLSVNSTK